MGIFVHILSSRTDMFDNMIFSVTVDNTEFLQSVTELMKNYMESEAPMNRIIYYIIDDMAGLILIKHRYYETIKFDENWSQIDLEVEPNGIFEVIDSYFHSDKYLSLLASRPIPQYNDDSTYGKGLRIYHPNPYAKYGWNIYRHSEKLNITDEFTVCQAEGNKTIEILPFDEKPATIEKTLDFSGKGFSLWDVDFIVEPYPCEYHK